MLLWEQFLLFENRNNLFKYKDSRGINIWDIIRFHIYINLLWGKESSLHCNQEKRDYKYIVYNIYSWVKAMFLRKKYLFFLTSRNKKENGVLYDKNVTDAMASITLDDTILLESYVKSTSSHLKYDGGVILGLFPFSFCTRFIKIPDYDFTQIFSLVKSTFPQSSITISELQNLYKLFCIQYKLYTFYLRKWRVKKVFLTQNGIQKGLIAACKKINVPIYEFQHGIVDRGHLAYSYPQGISCEDIYLPDRIFSFSDFWFGDMNLPGVRILAIGNNSFAIPESIKSADYKKGILVVSGDVFGKDLSDFIMKCLSEPFYCGYTYYFKLHPNQYFEYSLYLEKFKKYPQVKVLKDELDIPSLIKFTDVLLTIQSTAVYEGLQQGERICILKRSSYLRQAHIFGYKNVFLIDEPDDFKQVLLKDSGSIEHPKFFLPFDRKTFEEILNE